MTYQKLTSDELEKIKIIEQITNFDRLKEINDDISEELKELRKERYEDFEKNPYIGLGISESYFH